LYKGETQGRKSFTNFLSCPRENGEKHEKSLHQGEAGSSLTGGLFREWKNILVWESFLLYLGRKGGGEVGKRGGKRTPSGFGQPLFHTKMKPVRRARKEELFNRKEKRGRRRR